MNTRFLAHDRNDRKYFLDVSQPHDNNSQTFLSPHLPGLRNINGAEKHWAEIRTGLERWYPNIIA